jgi:hypothetical protein
MKDVSSIQLPLLLPHLLHYFDLVATPTYPSLASFVFKKNPQFNLSACSPQKLSSLITHLIDFHQMNCKS